MTLRKNNTVAFKFNLKQLRQTSKLCPERRKWTAPVQYRYFAHKIMRHKITPQILDRKNNKRGKNEESFFKLNKCFIGLRENWWNGVYYLYH